MKKAMALCLAVVIFLCVALSGEITVARAATEKIAPDLREQLSTTSDSENSWAYVVMNDIDYNQALSLFSSLYPEEYAIYLRAQNAEMSLSVASERLAADKEQLQLAIEKKREVIKQCYLENNNTIIDSAFPEEKQVFVSTYAPIAIVEVDMVSAVSAARDSEIVSMYSISNELVTSESEQNTYEAVSNLDEDAITDLILANTITRAGYIRDTYGYTGSGVKIGIVEAEGIPDITNQYLENANITINQENSVISDHATVVAGILVASDENGDYGIVPDAQLYCVSIESTVSLYGGIEWLVDNGVSIINASLGYPSVTGYYDIYSAWIDHLAVMHDVHFVKSAGNNSSYITSPGMAYNAITVGELAHNGSDLVSGFTIRGTSSYMERDVSAYGLRAEKPNLVASGSMGYTSAGSTVHGTSFAAPQAAGVIAQMCCYDDFLKIRQALVGAVLMASAAEKVEAVGDGAKGDVFVSSIQITPQISNKEGAGILDAQWARWVLAKGNCWSYSINSEEFPYSKTVYIDAETNSTSRIALFWLKRNSICNCEDSSTASGYNLANLELYIYDPNGNLVGSSSVPYGNFEIVQFAPTISGNYTIKIIGTSQEKERVGIAVW